MIKVQNGLIPYYQFSIFQDYSSILRHAITTRHGMEDGNFRRSLNLGFNQATSAPSHEEKNRHAYRVIENRKQACYCIGANIDDLFVPDISQSDNVFLVTEECRGKGCKSSGSAIPNIDGVITNSTNIPIMIFGADCGLLIVFDPKTKALGLIHCGWKGASNALIIRAIDDMDNTFSCSKNGSLRERLLVGISPMICEKCYSIDKGAVKGWKRNEILLHHGINPHHFLIEDKSKGTNFLDLKGLIKIQLKISGVLSKNIEDADICTVENVNEFYSFRGENKSRERGNFGLLAMIKG